VGRWYDACDELGILVYHDMLYADIAQHPPIATPSQTEELLYQVRAGSGWS